MFKFLCRFFVVVVPAFLTHFKFYVCFLFLILGRLFLFLLFLLIISYLSLTLLSQSIVYIPSLFAVSLMTFFSVAYFMIFLNIPWVIKRVYLYSFSFFVRVFFFFCCGMWDLPCPRIKPMPLLLGARSFTTGPLEES